MKINVTGFSSAHNTGQNRKNMQSMANTLPIILRDMGYEADNNLENADINIVCVGDMASLNNINMINCLKLLKQDNTLLSLDDWQQDPKHGSKVYASMHRYVELDKFSPTHPHHKKSEVDKYRDVLENIYYGKYKTLYHAYKFGNHDLLGIRGDKKYNIDPSIYIPERYNVQDNDFLYLLPVEASLLDNQQWLKTKKYTMLKVRGETEDKVIEYYQKHRLVLAPPYIHNGAGWFRVRYALANMVKAVIIEDEGTVFGETYAIQRKTVNERNIDGLFQLQDQAYQKTIMTKEEIHSQLEKYLFE